MHTNTQTGTKAGIQKYRPVRQATWQRNRQTGRQSVIHQPGIHTGRQVDGQIHTYSNIYRDIPTHIYKQAGRHTPRKSKTGRM